MQAVSGLPCRRRPGRPGWPGPGPPAQLRSCSCKLFQLSLSLLQHLPSPVPTVTAYRLDPSRCHRRRITITTTLIRIASSSSLRLSSPRHPGRLHLIIAPYRHRHRRLPSTGSSSPITITTTWSGTFITARDPPAQQARDVRRPDVSVVGSDRPGSSNNVGSDGSTGARVRTGQTGPGGAPRAGRATCHRGRTVGADRPVRGGSGARPGGGATGHRGRPPCRGHRPEQQQTKSGRPGRRVRSGSDAQTAEAWSGPGPTTTRVRQTDRSARVAQVTWVGPPPTADGFCRAQNRDAGNTTNSNSSSNKTSSSSSGLYSGPSGAGR